MTELAAISDLPSQPAVYALYGGRGRGLHVAYVGSARDLRNRVTQHLIRRDSSITTGVTVAMLNADHVTQVRWWEHPSFADETHLLAAELLAFETWSQRCAAVASPRSRRASSPPIPPLPPRCASSSRARPRVG